MAGMFEQLMDQPSVADRRRKAQDDTAMRRRMQMRLWFSEARRLYPGRPEMQKLHVMRRATDQAVNAQRDSEILHGIGDNVTNPRAVRM